MLDQEAEEKAWKQYHEQLLNVEFPWNPKYLYEKPLLEEPSQQITSEMIAKAISKIWMGKAVELSGIVVEM